MEEGHTATFLCDVFGSAITFRKPADGATDNFTPPVRDASLDGSKAEDVVKYVEENIAYVKQQLGAKVSFVISDSASANTKARRILSEKYSSLLFQYCKAHQVNLVVKHVLKNAMFCRRAKPHPR